MNGIIETPEFLPESSWEVCSKMGGIYTILSTKAHAFQQIFNDKVIFIGSDVWADTIAPDFTEDVSLFEDWRKHAEAVDHLKAKAGRWNVPDAPPVMPVDSKSYFSERDAFSYSMWENFRVESIHAYGDYDESCIFAYTVDKVIESLYHFYRLENRKVVALLNEWALAMGALYIQEQVSAVATLFTTHTASIGRSIAGNNKVLCAYTDGCNSDQVAKELNAEAKHSIEKQAVHYVDCFTTVSDITAREYKQLLGKTPDIVTPSGFEPNFVPEGKEHAKRRKEARRILINVTGELLDRSIDPNALPVSTSDRYEYRDKGIDVFIEAVNRVCTPGRLRRKAVAFVMIPAQVRAVRTDLKEAIEQDIRTTFPFQIPFIMHWLHNMSEDKALNYISHAGLANAVSEKLKIIFVPYYLGNKGGTFNKTYYDMLIGMDAIIYPSYYEPRGYTPLEGTTPGIPTITINLAGLGMWAKKTVSGNSLSEDVEIINRTDFNYFEVADAIMNSILVLSQGDVTGIEEIKQCCFDLTRKAGWSKFTGYYLTAFDIAIEHAEERNS